MILYGAMLGDMIGSPYEFINGPKTKNIDLFDKIKWIRLTDDSFMTLAIAKALTTLPIDSDEQTTKKAFITNMQDIGRRYESSYGTAFKWWLNQDNPKPYGSYGNGSAMRVSAIGWLYNSLERTREVARWSAEISHNHPEGIKGAESIASAIYLARTGKSIEEIKQYIIDNFNYDLSRTCDEIRPTYQFNEICQTTVPEAITAFLESTSFEDAIRTAYSLGGDCDTLTCITGSIAEAYYKEVPQYMIQECHKRLDDELLKIQSDFSIKVLNKSV